MLKTIFDHIKQGSFKDFRGSEMHLKIPISIQSVNKTLKEATDKTEALETVEVLSIQDGLVTVKFTLDVSVMGSEFEVLNREIVLKFDPILEKPEFLLRIEVIEGLGRIEHELLDILFRTLLKNDTLHFNNRVLILNHREFTGHEIYQGLLENLASARLVTDSGLFIYELSFEF